MLNITYALGNYGDSISVTSSTGGGDVYHRTTACVIVSFDHRDADDIAELIRARDALTDYLQARFPGSQYPIPEPDLDADTMRAYSDAMRIAYPKGGCVRPEDYFLPEDDDRQREEMNLEEKWEEERRDQV
jgi:hypothetical protein